MLPFTKPQLMTACSVVALVATVALSACGDKTQAPESIAVSEPGAEPGPSPNAAADAAALLELDKAKCAAGGSAVIAWVCQSPAILDEILKIYAASEKMSAEDNGSMGREMLQDAYTGTGELLTKCLNQAKDKAACINTSYAGFRKFVLPSTTEATVVASQGSETAPVVAEPKSVATVGRFTPYDFRTMTVAEYKAMQNEKLEQARSYWAKRLPELKVNVDCSVPTSPNEVAREEVPVLESAAKACNGSLRALLSDTKGMRRDGYAANANKAVWDNGCVEDALWLRSQCFREDYRETDIKHPSFFEPISLEPRGAAEWKKIDATRDILMTRFAMRPANWKNGWEHGNMFSTLAGNQVGRSGLPELVRMLAATGYDLNTPRSVNTFGPESALGTAIWDFSLNDCDRTPITEEHCAGRFEVVKALVAYGADLEKASATFGTPMKQAISRNSALIIEFLTWAGANKPVPVPGVPWDPRLAECIDKAYRKDRNDPQIRTNEYLYAQAAKRSAGEARCRFEAAEAARAAASGAPSSATP